MTSTLTTLAREPELDLRNPLPVAACNPSAGEAGTDGSLRCWQLGGLRDELKNTKRPSVLVRVSMARVCFSSHTLVTLHHEGVQPQIQHRDRSRGHRGALLTDLLLSLFSCRTQEHLFKDGITYNRLGLPHRSLVRKIPHRLAHGPVWRGLSFS